MTKSRENGGRGSARAGSWRPAALYRRGTATNLEPPMRRPHERATTPSDSRGKQRGRGDRG